VAPYQEEGMFMRLCVRKIYLLNIPISGLIGAITKALLKRVGPEWFAYGAGFLLLFATLYPLNAAFACAAGKQLKFARYFLGAVLGAGGAAVLFYLFPD
jgi:hypothetical protein